jgi:hypothetical protein
VNGKITQVERQKYNHGKQTNGILDLFLGRAVMISPDGFDRRQRREQRLFFCVRDLDECFAALVFFCSKKSPFSA